MNSITVAGQLGRDSEIRYLNNGDPVLSFSVADSQGKEKPTIWWRASLFGRRAEALAEYLKKGQAVTISGTVTEREYKDKDGAEKKSVEIRVAEVALQGGRREQQEPAAKQTHGEMKAAQRSSYGTPPPRPKSGTGFDDMDSDIPF
jgi:single-strand DNA-binding protein